MAATLKMKIFFDPVLLIHMANIHVDETLRFVVPLEDVISVYVETPAKDAENMLVMPGIIVRVKTSHGNENYRINPHPTDTDRDKWVGAAMNELSTELENHRIGKLKL